MLFVMKWFSALFVHMKKRRNVPQNVRRSALLPFVTENKSTTESTAAPVREANGMTVSDRQNAEKLCENFASRQCTAEENGRDFSDFYNQIKATGG